MLDEPLTGMDEPLKEHVVGYLERVRERWGMPMLLVSHDQVLVRRLAARVVVLDGGRVVDQGPTGQTLDHATISGMRAHPGPVNLLRVEKVERQETHAEGSVGGQRFYLGDAPEGETTVWVRFGAEDVALSVGDVPRLSMRNHLKGRVTEMVPIDAGRRLYVGVDVGGQRVWSQITDDAREDLGLDFDAEVVCLVKAAAVRIVN
jgi:molybdate transport system ATP-binding protein